jgi:TRAP-type C4-dicarboxylate transport system permease small subunit
MTSAPSDGPPPADREARAWRLAYDGLGHVGGFILAVMTLAVCFQVIMRFFGRNPIDGIDEIPRYLFVWLVMIGGASAMYRREHTVLDYFVRKLGARGQAAVSAFVNLVGILFLAYLIKLSWVLVPNAQLQTSAGLELPLGYVFAAIPVGSALFILPMLRNLIQAVKAIWPKPS